MPQLPTHRTACLCCPCIPCDGHEPQAGAHQAGGPLRGSRHRPGGLRGPRAQCGQGGRHGGAEEGIRSGEQVNTGSEIIHSKGNSFDIRYHLIHSVALLGVGLARRPRLSGLLMVAGMVGFCGTTYYHAFTGDKQFRRLTPYGGMLLIAAWLSLAL